MIRRTKKRVSKTKHYKIVLRIFIKYYLFLASDLGRQSKGLPNHTILVRLGGSQGGTPF